MSIMKKDFFEDFLYDVDFSMGVPKLAYTKCKVSIYSHMLGHWLCGYECL